MSLQIFLFILIWRHMTSNTGCSTFGKRSLPLMRSGPVIPYRAVMDGVSESVRIFLRHLCHKAPWPCLNIQCESKKPLRGPDIFRSFHKRLRIFDRFFTHLLYVLIHARLQIFIQLSPILTKLCHIKRDCLVYIMSSLK